MVNYSRMEDVWRSYGPAEPLGQADTGRQGRAKGVVVFGLAAVVGAGAVLGLYMRPDSTPAENPRREARPAAASQPAPRLAQATVVEPSQEVGVAPAIIAAPPPPAAAGGALPSETVPPSSAPGASLPSRASTAVARAITGPTEPGPPARVASAPAPVRAPVATILPPPAAPQAPVVARVEPAPPRVVPQAPKPLVLARREDPPAPPVRAPVVRETPSFDCSSAQGAGAQAVCSDPRLARLDRIMAAEFAAAVAAGHDRARLELDQDSWLARREAAAPDPNAVADVYRRRINQLRSMW
jgi:hypothetical protein